MCDNFRPIFELSRGKTIESIHFGAIAVVDSSGRLLARLGNPQLVTFLRSSSKPLQVLPFIEQGGDQAYHLTSKEIAVLCASHSGTDEHVAVIRAIQAKVDVQESDLLCGVHPPYDLPTAEAMKARGELPTSNRHNCSGKHTGMLAFARMRSLPINDYVNNGHPVQQMILTTMAEMCRMPVSHVELGMDGCSAPNFAMPLYNAARGFASLCDPRGLSIERAAACKRVTNSMVAYPGMVGGPGRFDTCLMEACGGRILAKGGAEGYVAMGVMPGALGAESPGIGIVLKVSDGDLNGRVRPAVSLEILRQLDFISPKELKTLEEFGPSRPVYNWRKLQVGESHPSFELEKADTQA